MDYTDLLIEADSLNLVTKEKPLKAHCGRIKGNKIAIRKDLTETEKKCVLAEELGHYHTTVGNILDQSDAGNRKQEYRARVWAYNHTIGLHGIIQSCKTGHTSASEAAEYLEVTEQFFIETIQCYKNKYGLYTTIDNYMIFFEPLGVLELYK